MLYLQIILASFIAGTLDTVTGFGGGLLLLPVLVMVAGSKDAVLLAALIPLGWNIPRVILMREWIDWRTAALFALGVAPGAMIGAALLDAVDPDLLRRVIGGALILFGLYYLIGLYVDMPQPRRLKRWTFPVVGLISGAIGSLLGAGHGPMQTSALAAAEMPVRQIAATNGVIGGTTAVARLIGYGAEGLLHEDLWIPGVIGVIAAAAGSMLGIRLSRRSKDSTLELVVSVAVVLAGVKMIL